MRGACLTLQAQFSSKKKKNIASAVVFPSHVTLSVRRGFSTRGYHRLFFAHPSCLSLSLASRARLPSQGQRNFLLVDPNFATGTSFEIVVHFFKFNHIRCRHRRQPFLLVHLDFVPETSLNSVFCWFQAYEKKKIAKGQQSSVVTQGHTDG